MISYDELILYTFYSEDFREGASRKYSLGKYLREKASNWKFSVDNSAFKCNPTQNKKSFLFNKENSFNMKATNTKDEIVTVHLAFPSIIVM